MEWLTDLEWVGGRLLGTVATGGGEQSVEIADLHVRGLPEASKGTHSKVMLNFADVAVVDPRPCLVAAGLDLPTEGQNQHDAFAFTHEGSTFVVPALLLMREVFAPARFLLPAMFKPQALDHVSRVEYGQDGPRVVLDAYWAPMLESLRLRSPLPALNWLHAYPSAQRMARSVFDAAQAGRLSMSLPRASASFGVKGVACGATTLVTSLNLYSVEPEEEPSFAIQDVPTCIAFRPAGWSSGKARCTVRPVIPKKSDGSVDVDDDEWRSIREFLLIERSGRKSTHCRRAMLNGVLRKHSSGVSWERCQYLVGTWMNAAQVYRDWSKRGDFERIMQVLAKSRASA